MSLMDILAQVATEMAAAKGASGTMKSQQSGRSNGGLFGDAPAREQSGGLQDIMGDLLGGKGSSSGGLGGLLDGLAGNNPETSTQPRRGGLDDVITQTDNSGGLGGLLEQLAGGKGGGGLGDLLGQLAGGSAAGGGGNFGDMLNQALTKSSAPKPQPTRGQEVAAGLMLKAMIQAAKADGKVDAGERDKLLDKLGDVSAAEREFVQREMAAPLDSEGLARQVPRGLENQVYAMSVLGIDLDVTEEAQYLHQFASHLQIGKETVNHIHDKFGVPRLYR